MSMVFRACALVLALCGGAALAAETAKPALAVLDLEAKGPTQLEADAVTAGVARGLRDLEVFNVLAADDVRQLLAIERTRQLIGASDGSTPFPLAESLGARHAVIGAVRGTKDALTVELRLLDTVSQKVVAQKALGPAPLAVIAKDIGATAQELLGPLLAEQQGLLLVRTSEEGAEIRVDDVLKGSSPQRDPLALPRGAHRLEVRKDGFIAALKPLRIQPNETTVEEVKLVPSADYAEAYRLRHGRLRIGAWISTVVAVGAIGGALYLDRSSEQLFQDAFVPRRAALLGFGRESLTDAQRDTYDACLDDGRTLCTEMTRSAASQIGTQQYATIGLASLGAIATGAAAYLWLSGEDPNRYSRLVAGISLGPTPAFALSGTF